MGAVVNTVALMMIVMATWLVTRWTIDRSDSPFPPLECHECHECEGVGALVGSGPLRPCPVCGGTGV
ncbi:MAG: hypothetical protein ACR2QE_12795 [Acidimicrobiales bacterium]